jgi:hypothetical protein
VHLSHTHLATSFIALPQIFLLGLPQVVLLRVHPLEEGQHRHPPPPSWEQRDQQQQWQTASAAATATVDATGFDGTENTANPTTI